MVAGTKDLWLGLKGTIKTIWPPAKQRHLPARMDTARGEVQSSQHCMPAETQPPLGAQGISPSSSPMKEASSSHFSDGETEDRSDSVIDPGSCGRLWHSWAPSLLRVSGRPPCHHVLKGRSSTGPQSSLAHQQKPQQLGHWRGCTSILSPVGTEGCRGSSRRKDRAVSQLWASHYQTLPSPSSASSICWSTSAIGLGHLSYLAKQQHLRPALSSNKKVS